MSGQGQGNGVWYHMPNTLHSLITHYSLLFCNFPPDSSSYC
jgi:hypothetical protein